MKDELEKLEYLKWLLSMKDHWTHDDFREDDRLDEEIKKLKNKMKEEK